jgi:large subunit ribosomal protein L21
MLKKLKKTLSKEIKNRYDKMEGRYLGLENRIYATIEDRLTLLEAKFDDLSDLIKDEVRFRKERNEDKIEDIDEGVLFSDTVEEVKEIIDETIKDTKEKVKVAKNVVNGTVAEAKKIVASKLKKGKKAKAKAEKKAEKKVKETVKKVKEAVEDVAKEIKNDDLKLIKGLGEKMAEKLNSEGITSFEQLAKMTEKEVNALDAKIKSFAARFNRYEWGKQAKDQ